MNGPLLLQGAMEVETDWLAAWLEGRRERAIGAFRFWSGVLAGQEVVVSRTGIGELNAACATALGIREFHPRAVLNQGIAGAHREDLRVGDLVVGERVAYLNAWDAPTRGAGEGSDPFSWAPGEGAEVLPSDEALTAALLAAPYAGGRKRSGTLGSGDLFTREADRIRWLRARFGQLCEDMESAGCYVSCARLGVPCAGVRIISNNELTGEAYQREMGLVLQRFLLGALAEI